MPVCILDDKSGLKLNFTSILPDLHFILWIRTPFFCLEECTICTKLPNIELQNSSVVNEFLLLIYAREIDFMSTFFHHVSRKSHL